MTPAFALVKAVQLTADFDDWMKSIGYSERLTPAGLNGIRKLLTTLPKGDIKDAIATCVAVYEDLLIKTEGNP